MSMQAAALGSTAVWLWRREEISGQMMPKAAAPAKSRNTNSWPEADEWPSSKVAVYTLPCFNPMPH